MTDRLTKIETMISQAAVSQKAVLQTAGLHHDLIGRVRRGERADLTPAVERQMRLAISYLKREAASEAREKDADPTKYWEYRAAAEFRLAVAFVAQLTGTSAAEVLSHDPAQRATASPAWLRASRIRHIALYIVNQHLGVSQAVLARVAGVSRAAVCHAIRDLEIESETTPAELERAIRLARTDKDKARAEAAAAQARELVAVLAEVERVFP